MNLSSISQKERIRYDSVPFFFNFAGFLIQTIPCMLLCLLPFPEESFSVRRRTMVLLFSAGLGLSAAVFSFFICFPGSSQTTTIPPILLNPLANLFMAFTLAVCVFFFFRTVHESMWKKMLVFCLMLDYSVFLYVSVNMLLLLLPSEPSPLIGVYSACGTFLYFLFTLLMLPPCWYFMQRKLSVYLERIDSRNLRRYDRPARQLSGKHL